MNQIGILGALVVFTRRGDYAQHGAAAAAFGLGPMSDQALGGALMWAPGGLIFMGAGFLVVWRSLASGSRAAGVPAS